MVNFCAGSGILFSVAAVVLIIFGQIGQLSTSTVTRNLRIVSIDVSGLGEAIGEVTNNGANNLTDLYNQNTPYYVKDPVGPGRHDGLRKVYEFGLWNYCSTNGAVGSSPRSYCTRRGFGSTIQPAIVLQQDIPERFAPALTQVLPDSVFTADAYLGTYTKAATYLIFVGSIAAALVMLIGLIAQRFAFFLGSLLALLSFLSLAVGLVIYTVIISRVISSIDSATVQGVDLGVSVSYGYSLWILWAATGVMLLSILPFAIACCTGRHDKGKEVYVPKESY
ncbi:hypothetical protein OIV83_006357 [Microbotryomycetes sp. JL201]|nr:hypothetical protein OIV83_006357 [Microbotryomycetes sp. JL201]